MFINKKFFPEIMLDNDEMYICHMEGVISSVDELAEMEIVKTLDRYHFRIVTSLPKYNQMLLQEILKLNNVYGIKLDLSKSIKSSGTIAFDIKL